MVDGDSGGSGGTEAGSGSAQEASAAEAAARDDAAAAILHPNQSPLYHAQHADRYQRQALIEAYETRADCKFVAAVDVIDIDFVQNVEEHIYQESGQRDIHMLLRSPGGDGEMAIRAIRAIQARTSKVRPPGT